MTRKFSRHSSGIRIPVTIERQSMEYAHKPCINNIFKAYGPIKKFLPQRLATIEPRSSSNHTLCKCSYFTFQLNHKNGMCRMKFIKSFRNDRSWSKQSKTNKKSLTEFNYSSRRRPKSTETYWTRRCGRLGFLKLDSGTKPATLRNRGRSSWKKNDCCNCKNETIW